MCSSSSRVKHNQSSKENPSAKIFSHHQEPSVKIKESKQDPPDIFTFLAVGSAVLVALRLEIIVNAGRDDGVEGFKFGSGGGGSERAERWLGLMGDGEAE
ncbi:hypothetical protein Droror1_Dr00017388 [Drosera rotundifolia]